MAWTADEKTNNAGSGLNLLSEDGAFMVDEQRMPQWLIVGQPRGRRGAGLRGPARTA